MTHPHPGPPEVHTWPTAPNHSHGMVPSVPRQAQHITPLDQQRAVVHQSPAISAESFSLPRPALVPEDEPVRISVDNNRCHIYGICQQEAPEVFRISEGGSLHYTRGVPAELAAKARQAARCCPMQAVAIEGGQRPGPGSSGDRRGTRPVRSGTGARTSSRRIVVAGAGLAGLSAAARLRERGFDGELVIVGEEPHRPYSRPPLSKQYLSGELSEEQLMFRADAELDAHWLLNTRLVGLDLYGSALEMPGGERLPFEGLVVATGVGAKRLPEAPLFSERVRTIRTLRDAAAVRQAMDAARARHVVILGGGFVGCELACTARDSGLDVTLVVHSAPLLRRVLGERLGAVVGDIQRRAGVDVRLGTQVVDWQDHGDVLRLRLDDDEIIDCDFVVLGLGGEPRTEWLRGSGLDISDGVLCAATCHAIDAWGRPLRTSSPQVTWLAGPTFASTPSRGASSTSFTPWRWASRPPTRCCAGLNVPRASPRSRASGPSSTAPGYRLWAFRPSAPRSRSLRGLSAPSASSPAIPGTPLMVLRSWAPSPSTCRRNSSITATR